MLATLAITIASTLGPVDQAPLAHRVSEISITVGDLDRSIRFFTEVLDFQLDTRESRCDEAVSRLLGVADAHIAIARLHLGSERIELIDFLSFDGRPVPADSRSNDRWFQHMAIVVSDLDLAYEHLAAHNVTSVSIAPQTLPSWNSKARGIRAFYFKDPDDHVLEIIQFPRPWRACSTEAKPATDGAATLDTPSNLFLGIDHTAIVTADTDRALKFYHHTLGLEIVGESDNYGLEQERLNNVFGAHLRITTLRGASGPGIELLEYLTPTTGRQPPQDSLPSDLWHWHVTITTPVPQTQIESTMTRIRAPRISAAPRDPEHALPSFLVRDPDGHAIRFVSP